MPISYQTFLKRRAYRKLASILEAPLRRRLKDWDESQHPREPAGSPEGGQFTGGDGGAPTAGDPGPHLDPAVVEVGGDAWNIQTAQRLEREYQTAKPKLEAMIERVKHEGSVETEVEVSGAPGEWDNLSGHQQEQVEESWVQSNMDSELEYQAEQWREYDAPVQAGKELADDAEWRAEMVQEWLDNYDPVPENLDVERLANAISITTNEDYGSSKAGDIEEIEWNENTLTVMNPQFNPDQVGLPGIPDKQSPVITLEQQQEIEEVIRDNWDQQRERLIDKMDLPDYLSEQAHESLTEAFATMDDDEKYKLAEQHFSDEWENETQTDPGILRDPPKWELFNNNKSGYDETRQFGRIVSLERTAELMEQRGIKIDTAYSSEGSGHAGYVNMANHIDTQVWDSWKGSSSNTASQALQLAAAQELGGRERLDETEERLAIAHANRNFPGGFDGLKAYVRGKWETTQYMMEKAGMPKVESYRAIMLDGLTLNDLPKEEVTVDDFHKFQRLPTLQIERNGLASFTADSSIANTWNGVGNVPMNAKRVVLRASVPRTAVLSLPVYGQNLHNEKEVVLAGTAWNKWDAWRDRAPLVDRAPVKGMQPWLRREDKDVFLDLTRFEIETGAPHWLSKLRDEKAIKDWNEEDHPRVPAGSPEGGQFTSGGEGGGGPVQPAFALPTNEGGSVYYQRPNVTVTSDVEEAVRLLRAGEVVELTDTRKVHTLLTRLAQIAQEAKAKGEEAPNFDLCKVTVAGTNLFCADKVSTVEYPKGVPRVAMPQFGGFPVPGSPADHLARDKNGEVNAAVQFQHYLRAINIQVTNETVPAAALKASQAELVGTKVAGMMLNQHFNPQGEAIFVSRDNYVVDGHHRWAAAVGRESETGSLGKMQMPVIRIDAPIVEILHLANAWTKDFGIAPKKAKRLEIIRMKYRLLYRQKYSEDQPRDDHGRWTSGGGMTESAKAAVHTWETQHNHDETESLAIINPQTGTVLATATSDESYQVKIPKEQLSLIDGSILTHNHPLERSLSRDDVHTAMRNNAKAVRAVTPNGNAYTLERIYDEWPSGLGRVYDKFSEDVNGKLMGQVMMGVMSGEKAEESYQHEVLNAVAAHYPKTIKYSKAAL